MRIIVQHGGVLRQFAVIESSGRDGSLTIVMQRNGETHLRAVWTSRPAEQSIQKVEYQTPRLKSKRISIHQSGRINYHENRRIIFVEPLTRVTRIFPVYGYLVPNLSKLDLHTKLPVDDDVVIDLSDLDGPVSFTIVLGPKNHIFSGRALKLAYEAEGYALVICVDQAPSMVPAGYENHFVSFTQESGLFDRQQMAEDQALIAHHQALSGSKGLIIYQPNGEGEIKLVFSVPMRVAPKFKIKFSDPDLGVLDQEAIRDGRSDKVMLRFKVRHLRSGQVIRRNVAIISIELDAEM